MIATKSDLHNVAYHGSVSGGPRYSLIWTVFLRAKAATVFSAS